MVFIFFKVSLGFKFDTSSMNLTTRTPIYFICQEQRGHDLSLMKFMEEIWDQPSQFAQLFPYNAQFPLVIGNQ